MQISYNLFQAQHRQKTRTHTIWCRFSSHSVKAVVSTGQFGERKLVRGSLLCNSIVFLWEHLTSFPEISAFGSELRRLGWSQGALPGTGWYGWALGRSWLHTGTIALLFCLSFYSKVIKFVGT